MPDSVAAVNDYVQVAASGVGPYPFSWDIGTQDTTSAKEWITVYAGADADAALAAGPITAYDVTSLTTAGRDTDSAGGEITLTTAVSTGFVWIIGNTPINREPSVPDSKGGAYINPDVMNTARANRQLRRELLSCVRLPLGEVATVLPGPTARADRSLVFDASGNIGVSTETQTSLTDAIAAASTSAAAAGVSASLASASATSAATSASNALAAANATAPVTIFRSKADADAALPSLSVGEWVEVLQDESQNNRRTRYDVETGPVFGTPPIFMDGTAFAPLDAEDYGVTFDGTTDDGPAFSSALTAAILGEKDLRLAPGGVMNLNTAVYLQNLTGQIRVFSPNDACQVLLGEGTTGIGEAMWRTDGQFIGTLTLTAYPDIGDYTISVSSTAGVEVGDLLHIDSSLTVEARNYQVQCVRRVGAISGSDIILDEPLRLPFPVTGSPVVNHWRSGGLSLANLHFRVMFANKALSLHALTESFIEDCTFEGISDWGPGTIVDPYYNVKTDGIRHRGCTFMRGRYVPNITEGSRDSQFRSGFADRIRHMDANTWAERPYFEDIVGRRTQELIQTHETVIDATFINVRDQVEPGETGLYGLNMRGLGGLVRDCTAISTGQSSPGFASGGTILDAAYEYLGPLFTKRFERFRSVTAAIGTQYCRNHWVIKECDIPFIQVDNTIASVTVDNATRQNENDVGATQATTFHRISRNRHIGDPGATLIAPVTEFGRFYRSEAITNISNANPAVVTAPGHGITSGNVYISGVNGMTEVNGNVYLAVNITADTFELNITDSTGFGTYTSGGVVEHHRVIDISNITQDASGGIVTTTDPHALQGGGTSASGIYVRLNGVLGMTEVNETVFGYSWFGTTTFRLLDKDTLAPIDTSGYTAYTSGGSVAANAIYQNTIQPSLYPGVGTDENSNYRSLIYSSTTPHGSTSLTIPVKLVTGRHLEQGRSAVAHGRISVRSIVGRCYEYNFIMSYAQSVNGGFASTAPVSEGPSGTDITDISITDIDPHFSSDITDEGGTIFDYFEYYITFNINITLASAAITVSRVDLFLEEVG